MLHNTILFMATDGSVYSFGRTWHQAMDQSWQENILHIHHPVKYVYIRWFKGSILNGL